MEYEYEVQGDYGYGWECLTTEESRWDAEQRLEDYNDNEPYRPHRIKRVKVSD